MSKKKVMRETAWDDVDRLLGGQLYLEAEEMEMDDEEYEDQEDLGDPSDDDFEEEEEGLTPDKVMEVINDMSAEIEDEEDQEFLQNLAAEVGDPAKMELFIQIVGALSEVEEEEEEDMELASDEEVGLDDPMDMETPPTPPEEF